MLWSWLLVLHTEHWRAVCQAVVFIIVMSDCRRPISLWRHWPCWLLPDLWWWRFRHIQQYLRYSAAVQHYLVKKTDIALPGGNTSELRNVTCHMGSHSVTCHPTQVNAPRLTPAMPAGTWFTYPGRMEGWADLVDLIAPRPGVELATFRSRVRRPTTAPPRQLEYSNYTGISFWDCVLADGSGRVTIVKCIPVGWIVCRIEL